MSRKIFVFAFMLTVAFAIIMPVVSAQTETVPLAPETTFGWVILAWFIYALIGLLASVTTPKEHFDAIKLARSFILMILTGVIAIALRITPGAIETQYGGILNVVATVVLNTGPGLTLIYSLDKLAKLIMNTKAKIEAARALSTPGPSNP
jgi:uncharacterized membrane protein